MRNEVLRLERIGKVSEYGRLFNVNLSAFYGEMLGLFFCDEKNGRLLLDIIAGRAEPDAGRYYVADEAVLEFGRAAMEEKGIYTIGAHSGLFQHLSLAENIYVMSRAKYPRFFINKPEIYRQTQALLDEFHFDLLSPEMNVVDFSHSTGHIIEIMKAYAHRARALVLENITENYTEKDVENLKGVLRTVVSKGVSVIFAANNYNDFADLMDEAIVLRGGTTVARVEKSQITKQRVINVMAGSMMPEPPDDPPLSSDNQLLRLEHVSDDLGVLDLTCSIYQGEVLGLLDTNGFYGKHVADILCGNVSCTGRLSVCNADDARALDHVPLKLPFLVGHIPENVDANGIFSHIGLRENVTIRMPDRTYTAGFLNKRIQNYVFHKALEDMDSLYLIEKYGNGAQLPYIEKNDYFRILLAKWVCADAGLVVFVNPHGSFDRPSQHFFKMMMNQLSGLAITSVVISTNRQMLADVCTRYIVLRDGETLNRER